jgi:dienelactone hydrolase
MRATTLPFAPRRAARRAAALALLAGACSDSAPVAPTAADAASLARGTVTEPATGPWSRVVEGATGPGSRYAIYVPRDWNGDAVFYAHGFRDAGTPVELRDQDALYAVRDALGAQGYAVAYSSYSENGFAVKDGAQRTHQLRGLLASQLHGQPERSYLVGHSLGAGISLQLAERHSAQYDGALLVCGMVGGSIAQTQYLGHVRALFDAYYPGALPGSVLGVPDGTVLTIPQIVAAVQTNPLGLLAIASTAQTPLPYVPQGSLLDPTSVASQTLVGSLYGALSFHARGINNILDLTNGQTPFDNAGTVYALGRTLPLPAPLTAAVSALVPASNGTVGRYTFGPSAENYLSHHFTPTGDLRVPVLTLHNAWDPAVPAFHEQLLLQAVQAAGATDMLLQRLVPSYGHCAISAQQVLQNFSTLTTWVESGVKPAQ